MAYNVSRFLKRGSDKMLIWAHGAHLGKAQVYGGMVGGTGKYILKHFPDNYFVLGTTTATGEVARTLDARVGTRSMMSALNLEQPVAGSWEALLGAGPLTFSYGFTGQLDPKNQLRAFRFVGYGGKSGAGSVDRVKLAELYDALLFIRVSHVPARLD